MSGDATKQSAFIALLAPSGGVSTKQSAFVAMRQPFAQITKQTAFVLLLPKPASSRRSNPMMIG